MAHLVTGYKGEEHIKSADDGSFNASFFGEGQFIMEAGNQMDASIISNNTVRVLDGDLLMYGRHVRIEPNTYEDMTIETGTAGLKRYDLIVMTYSKNASDGKETAYLEVIKGTETANSPSVPSYTNGNILEGATFNQMPLYKVYVDGVVLTSLELTCPIMKNIKDLSEYYAEEFMEACENHLGALNILDSEEEILANTQANQLAGALGVKEAVNELKKSVSDGKSGIASAITAQGVATSADATFATMATNIGTVATNKYNAGVSATKKGTASAPQVLSGYTFTNASGVNLSGSMVNRGSISNLESGKSYSSGYYTAGTCPSSDPVLLWTNSSPNQTMTTLNLSMDLSQYKAIIVSYNRTYASNPTVEIGRAYVEKGSTCKVLGISPNGAYQSERTYSFTDSAISGTYGSSGVCVIPLKIWGVK